MNQIHPFRCLGISPSSRGFGFAVVEQGQVLVHSGTKTAKGVKNQHCLLKVSELIRLYNPHRIVLEDLSANHRRAPRIRELVRLIASLAAGSGVDVRCVSAQEKALCFFPEGKGTKHRLAQLIAERFPNDLGSSVPPKRKEWTSEDARLGIFDAVALAIIGSA